MAVNIISVVAGLALVLFFAGRLVRGMLAFARGFGLSVFLVSVVFVGFDPENLAVGAVGAYEGAAGIVLGTIVGWAMVAIALAFGITALFVPLHFEHAPRSILLVPVLAVALIWFWLRTASCRASTASRFSPATRSPFSNWCGSAAAESTFEERGSARNPKGRKELAGPRLAAYFCCRSP